MKKTFGIAGPHMVAKLAFAAAMGGFLFGYDTAVINGGEQQIQSVCGIIGVGS